MPEANTAITSSGMDAPASPIRRMKTAAARYIEANRPNDNRRPQKPANNNVPMRPPI